MPAGDRGGRSRPFLRRRLRDSPRARAEARVARAHGLPRTIVLGRPWPAVDEPLFTREDTDYALALDELEQAEAAERCPFCGLPAAQCGDPDNQFRFTAEGRRCHATYAIAAAQAKDRDTDDTSANSTVWSVGLKPRKT